MVRVRLLACLLALVSSSVLAAPVLRFRTLTLQDGLSQNSVTAIAQDSAGYLWFGSQDGLNRYDGHRFTIFKNDPNDPRSIPANYVEVLLAGDGGDVWIGTRYGGLARFDAQTGGFETVPIIYEAEDARDARFVVHRLAMHDGELWAATDRGLARFDAKARALRLQPVPGVHAFPETRAVHADASGLWSGDVGRVLHLQNGAFRVLRLPEADLVVHALARDPAGVLMAGTNRGVYRMKASGTFERVAALPRVPFSTFASDSGGGFWAGGRGGVFHRGRGESAWQYYGHDAADPASVGQDIVFDIFESRDRVLWIGTYGGGLSRAVLSQRRFGLHQKSAAGLNSNIIFPIFEGPGGIVWIGTYTSGLNRWNRATGEWREYRHDPEDPGSLSHDEVRSLLADAAGRLWVGTHGGLDRLDPGADDFVHYRNDPENAATISSNGVTALFIDSAKRFWVGTWGGGLNRFDPETGRFTRLDGILPDGTGSGFISDIAEGPRGLLWIATDAGVLRMDPASNDVTVFRHDANNPGSLANDSVKTLWFDGAGHLWIGTANGLDRLDPASGEIRHYRERDGLANNLVLGILGDNEGNLWISTNRGLSRFDPDTQTFQTWHRADGLQSDEYNSFAYFRNDAGELFFGGIGGFNVFDPARIAPDKLPPPVRITRLSLFNAPLEPQPENPDAVLQKPADQSGAITLRFDQNLFSIEFAALHFADPARNRFAYRLRGFNEDWVETEAEKPFATFTNLDPGNYLFEVRAANPGGVWSARPAQLAVTVLPPWWRTMPAYLAYALFVAGLAWLVLQYMKKRIEVRYLAREKDAAEEATRLKSSFLALMSHEIRTPMNGVLGMVQLLARTRLSRRQRGYVEALEKSGESLLTILDDVLDFSRIEADVIEFESIPFDPREVAESVVLLLGPRAREKGLALAFRADALPAAVKGDPTRLRQVLMNLVSNAIKFTPAGGVKVRAAEQLLEPGRVRITFTVEDTGIGISEAQQKRLFDAFVQADTSTRRTYGGTGLGLSICKRLVEMQNGAIGVESVAGAGTVFWFEIDFDIAAAPPRVERAPERRGRMLRVLLVEDQPVNQEVARGLLEHEGHAVSVAPDGVTALKLLSEREFDVVLMDIHMPGMDGREVTRRIRALDDPVKAGLPVLGLTASISAEDVAACLNAGMNKVLRKPLPAARLSQALAQLDDDSETAAAEDEEQLLVDAPMLRQHRAALGEDRFRDILATFRQTAAMLVDAIEAAALAGDETALRRDAHRLAGAASSMGCRKLAAHAARVEQGHADAEGLRSVHRKTEHELLALERVAPARMDENA
ncbi:MAG TPA: two-component regulator propeller domain-containing protein [Gammaproteobacteria bacterium]